MALQLLVLELSFQYTLLLYVTHPLGPFDLSHPDGYMPVHFRFSFLTFLHSSKVNFSLLAHFPLVFISGIIDLRFFQYFP